MITTSYCVAALLLTGDAGSRAEGLYGAKLLKKLHPAPDVLYVQIGDDRDHMPPQALPHEDRSDYGRGPGGPRTGWRATGQPDGPKYQNRSDGLANLAGRCAAARVSIARMRPCASVLRKIFPCSMPGTARLWTYSARPVTLSRVSSRGMDRPTWGIL